MEVEEDVCSTWFEGMIWFEGMVNGDIDNADSPSTTADGVVDAPGAAVDVVPSLVDTIDTVDTALTGGHMFLLKLIFIVAPEAGENRTRPNLLRSFPGVAKNAVLFLLFLTDFTKPSVVVVDVALPVPGRLAEPKRFAWPTMRFLCPV